METQIRNIFAALVLLALSTLNAELSAAFAQSATVFPIATNPNLVEFGAGIAYDGSNFLVAMTVDTNVSVQLISSNGTLLGTPLNVGMNASWPPAVTLAFGQTNYLVAWSDYSIGSGVDMFGQFVTRSGTKFGSAFQLLQSQGTHGFQAVKALASDGTNFLVLWQDKSTNSLYGQLLNLTGGLSGSEVLISAQQRNGNNPALAFGNTNYLAVWQSEDGSQDEKTYGAFVSRSGFAGSPFQISQTNSTDHNPLAVSFDGTNYLVVWNWDIGSGAVEITNWDIRGRVVSQSGTFPSNELGLVTDPGSQVVPALAFDGLNYLLAWGDGSFNTTNSTIRFKFFDRSGTPIGPVFSVFTAQGTNCPLFAFNGLLFGDNQFAVAATLGTVQRNANGDIAGFPSGDVYGAFLPLSTTAPRLAVAGPRVGTQFPLLLTGTPGINYAIQMTTNLAPVNWTALVTNSPTDGTFNFTDTQATNAGRFYRAVKQ